MNYQIKRLSEQNIVDLIPIYKDAFGKDVSVDSLRKKQETALFGLSYVGFIAYSEEGEPAAFYGVFPCKIDYKGETFLAAQSGDTMTHSKHTGKGLFTKLALETYKFCKENGVHLVFGFPNQNSYPGFVKHLGWSHFDDIEAYVIKIRTLSWYRIHKHFKISNEKHRKWGEKVLKKYISSKTFPSSCKEINTPVVDHSDDFFNYKKYEKNYLLEINGIGVWVKFNSDALLIGDIEKVDESKLDKVIIKLKKITAKMFIPAVRYQGSTNTWIVKYFKKNGQKLKTTHAIGGVNFTNVIPMEKMKFTAADNDTF